jgi:hypothetical protein
MRLAFGKDFITYGEAPKADFLPHFIRERVARKKSSRAPVATLIYAIVICFVAYISATVIAFEASNNLSLTRETTNEVLASQTKYQELILLQTTAKRLDSARALATAQEILWQPFTDEILGTLTPGAFLETFEVTALSASGVESVVDPDVQSSVVATAEISASFPDLLGVEAWLENLAKVNGHAGSTLNNLRAAGDLFIADVTMKVSDELFARRYSHFEETGSEQANSTAAPSPTAEGVEN